MNVLRFAWRVPWVVMLVLAGLVIIALLYPWIGRRARLAIKRQWSRLLLVLCGVRTEIVGQPVQAGAVLWVVNHVSWLDIFVLNVVRSTTFVAKHEIRRWPVIGWLAAGADTIFIERGFRHAVHRVGQAMRLRFEREQAVGFFPEGTTSEGLDVLPFHANLFEPARQSDVVVQSVALRYFHEGQRSPLAAFVGQESLVQNLWRVLGARGVSVELVFMTPLADGDQEKPPRAEMARLSREQIRQAVLIERPIAQHQDQASGSSD